MLQHIEFVKGSRFSVADIKWFFLCYLCILFWAAFPGFDLNAELRGAPATEGRRFFYATFAALVGVPIALAAIKLIPYALRTARAASFARFLIVGVAAQVLVVGFFAGMAIVKSAIDLVTGSPLVWFLGWLSLIEYFLIMFWVPCFVAGAIQGSLSAPEQGES